MIEIRQKFPGSSHWIVREFEAFFVESNEQYNCIVQNQKEKDVLDGYCLIYGIKLTVSVGRHTLGPVSDDPYLFLWVVSVSEL